MSDYESHSGKLRLLQTQEGETLTQQCKRLWLENNLPEEEFHDESNLFGDLGEKYIEVDGKIWEVFDRQDHGDEDSFCRLTPNPDGTLSFHTRYYNGGTCMQ